MTHPPARAAKDGSRRGPLYSGSKNPRKEGDLINNAFVTIVSVVDISPSLRSPKGK